MNTYRPMNALASCLLAVLCLLQSTAVAADEKEILYWVAPMDPNYRRDEPGKSPMGMDLVPVYAGEGDGSSISIAPQFRFTLTIVVSPFVLAPDSTRPITT